MAWLHDEAVVYLPLRDTSTLTLTHLSPCLTTLIIHNISKPESFTLHTHCPTWESHR